MSEYCIHGKPMENDCIGCDEDKVKAKSSLSPAPGSEMKAVPAIRFVRLTVQLVDSLENMMFMEAAREAIKNVPILVKPSGYDIIKLERVYVCSAHKPKPQTEADLL